MCDFFEGGAFCFCSVDFTLTCSHCPSVIPPLGILECGRRAVYFQEVWQWKGRRCFVTELTEKTTLAADPQRDPEQDKRVQKMDGWIKIMGNAACLPVMMTTRTVMHHHSSFSSLQQNISHYFVTYLRRPWEDNCVLRYLKSTEKQIVNAKGNRSRVARAVVLRLPLTLVSFNMIRNVKRSKLLNSGLSRCYQVFVTKVNIPIILKKPSSRPKLEEVLQI